MSSTRNNKKVCNALVLIVVLAFVCASANAATRFVPSQYETIQAAINACDTGDVVVVAPGIYTGDGNRDVDFKGKSITVRGKNGPEKCIIDCQGSESDPHRGFYFHSGDTSSAVLDGFTIKNGYMHPGAGIYCNGSGPIIKNCKITGNKAEWLNGIGGGCYFSNSFAKIITCRITSNSAIGTSTHSGNGWGGGIACENSTLEIKNTEINNNYGTYAAGGVGAGWDSSLYIENCVVSHNSSQSGAGIHFQDSSPIITNSTITENAAEFSGGGFYCIRSNIIVVNTILWGDTGGEIDGWGSSIMVTYSDVQGGWEGEGNIHGDPLFRGPAAGDYHLLPNSPCIDAGTNTPPGGLPLTDIEGNSRPMDGDGDGVAVADMGAFEAPGPVDLLLDLEENIVALNLQRGITNSLTSKLYAVMQVLQDENENNDAAAIKSLQAFINTVEAQRGKQIPEADADALITDALQIIKLLSTG